MSEMRTPPVPLTVEGSWVLHQMFRVRWAEWRNLGQVERDHIARDAASILTGTDGSAGYSVLGHKGDLMLIHFRESVDKLEEIQRTLRKLRLFDFMEQSASYVSVVELGLYESTQKVYGSLAEKGLEPHSPEWDAAIQETLERQREAMRPRLYPEIPSHPYVCFYPMDRRRGEAKNWYQEPMAERARMMHEHGLVGRRYAGQVRQIITGSIGLDDWEWGVDLFTDDPLVFKKLIYEMRFDEVSAMYALFGTFYVGMRLQSPDLSAFLDLG
ncbi:MAG TPA: hydrogen peroxide-dependent heme synthase [Bryobacteraceae bacterium]|nr:hydrogen peroxide-dependent heme synthase [Bryobacteraceae bacterium]